MTDKIVETWREFKAGMVTQNIWLVMENALLRRELRLAKEKVNVLTD